MGRMDTAEALNAWMDQNGYTAWTLAVELGVSPATVRGYMDGKHEIKRVFALAVATLGPYERPQRPVRERPERKQTKGDLVREHLIKHYPCAALPLGALSEIAAQFGVTRERVRQIAVGLGYPGWHSQSPEQRVILGKMGRKLCISCGKPYGRGRYAEDRIGRIRCEECRWTEVSCTECGKLKRVRTSRYLSSIGRTNKVGSGAATYTGAQFCNRVCFGRYIARTAGFLAHRENAVHHGHAARLRADRNRAAILEAIRVSRTVAEIVAVVGLEVNAVYRHLNALKAEGKATYTESGRGGKRMWAIVEEA